MSEQIFISIIIVTWNSEDEIAECLSSIFDSSANVSFEIIIIDNNSSDKTIEVLEDFENKFPGKIKIILNKKNLGFTKGCNQGIRIASGKNILLLNPDTKITGNAIELLNIKLDADENTGAIAPQLINYDMTIQKSCRTFPGYFDMFCEMTMLSKIFPDSHLLSNWKMNYFSHDEERIVKQPMAAALMVKKKVMNEINNFDERYEMFFNDVDLCKKINAKGYKILFYPEVKIFHTKGVSIYKDRVRMIKIWNEDCLKYFKKYYYKNNFFLYNWLLISLKVTGFFRILHYKLTK